MTLYISFCSFHSDLRIHPNHQRRRFVPDTATSQPPTHSTPPPPPIALRDPIWSKFVTGSQIGPSSSFSLSLLLLLLAAHFFFYFPERFATFKILQLGLEPFLQSKSGYNFLALHNLGGWTWMHFNNFEPSQQIRPHPYYLGLWIYIICWICVCPSSMKSYCVIHNEQTAVW